MSDFIEQREDAYEQLLGREYSLVYHESEAATPHVDVYVFPPTDDEEFFTLITGGMSDLRMSVPDPDSPGARAELVMFVREPRPELVEVMRRLAHFPHDNKTWLGWGHTVPWGEPIVPGSELDTILLAGSEVGWDDDAERLTVDGDPVSLYQVAAITKNECELKLRQGANALVDLFIERGASLVVDPERPSYVADDEVGEPFPFDEPPTLGVFTTRDIMEGSAPVLLVAHEQNGDWQFLPGTPIETDDLVLLHLSHIVADHPDVHELSDLPLGWAAERASTTDPWERYLSPEEDA